MLEIHEELKPSTRALIDAGPARVPKACDSCGILLPNLMKIMRDS